MGLEGSVGCGGLAVSLQHRARRPAGQLHQLALLAATEEVVVGERMPEPMRIEVVYAGLRAATAEHLRDAVRRQPALQAEPQPRLVGAGMPITDAQIPVERGARVLGERDFPRPGLA